MNNYPRFKITVDGLCLFPDNRVLIIKRDVEPGKGLWAFPGGNLDENENFQQCVSREVYEETGLDSKPSEWNFLHINSDVDRISLPYERTIGAFYYRYFENEECPIVKSEISEFKIVAINELLYHELYDLAFDCKEVLWKL